MTTFTKLESSEGSSISVDPARRLSPINKNIYGGFIEHMGRAIYGGIYDPGSPLADERGFRLDVAEALKSLDIPVVRYPGGNFVATYHWLDGIGPREHRPPRPELAWEGIETNQFGTDEFMGWCKFMGTEPYLALNFGTGTLDEALAWLEYCNGTRNTYYANLRRQNGHSEPYNVKYWALGNEMWGPWQIGQMTKEDYSHRALQWAKALKIVDPSITLILCGQDGTSTWDFYTLKNCYLPAQSALSTSAVSLIDMHSIHLYTTSNSHLPNVTAPRAAERAIEITSALIDLVRVENKVPPNQKRSTICFDEWNVWDPKRAIGSEGAEERYTLSDALAVGAWLNVLVRKSKDVEMANIAQSVNVISPLMTTKDSIIKQTTWWPLWLFCRYMHGWTISCHVAGGAYEGATEPAWIRGAMDTPWLDVSATVDREGWVNVCIINIHEEKSIEVQLLGLRADTAVSVYLVTGKNIRVTNMDGQEEVGILRKEWKSTSLYTFPKHSLTLMRWKA